MSASTGSSIAQGPAARAAGHQPVPPLSADSRDVPRARPRHWLALWYERSSKPGGLLLLVVLALYAPSLGDGFMLDDHRALRVLREYASGERESPEVYRFLTGDPEANRREREEGWYAWWIADDLRYQHMRPLAEWLLYGEYRLFGEWPTGYRLVSLLTYALGVLLVLRLLRLVSGDERLARWGAMIFAVAASHAIPVLFVSSQGDVLALVCAVGTAIAAGHFVREGGVLWLALFLAAFAAGLGMKEAVLPLVASPLLFLVLWRSSDRQARDGIHAPAEKAVGRALLAVALAAALSLFWLALYVRNGFGSNTSVMLDPIHDLPGYLLALPLRTLLLLSTWVIPVNPFLFEFQIEFKTYEWVYAVVGGATLAAIAIMFWRRHRRQHGVAEMAVWVLAFLPILVCTPPDDRVMILPSIGLAFLGAAWMTRPRNDGSSRLRRLPVLLFLVMQVATVWTTGRLLAYLEKESQLHVRQMAEAFGRPMRDGDHAFAINNPFSFEGLFMQDRLRNLTGWQEGSAAVLTDVRDPRIIVVDSHTLRLEADDAPLLSSFLGRMGTTRARPKQAGDVFDTGEFTATILKTDARGVQAVELRFRQPLTSEQYRFFMVDETGSPMIWTPHESNS